MDERGRALARRAGRPAAVSGGRAVGVGRVQLTPLGGRADGDPAYPEEIDGVPVREHLRTRRDHRGALVALVDGRYAVTGPTLARGRAAGSSRPTRGAA